MINKMRDAGLKLTGRMNPHGHWYSVSRDGNYFGKLKIKNKIVIDYIGPFENIIYIGDEMC